MFSSFWSVCEIVISEFVRLGNYLEAYPIVLLILVISIVLDVSMMLKYLINS